MADTADRSVFRGLDGNPGVVGAAAGVFEQWYASDRRRDLYNVASCCAYLDWQDRTSAMLEYFQLFDIYLSEPSILPDRKRYDCLVSNRFAQ